MRCKHMKLEDDGYIPKCTAFPRRIPREIFNETIDHDKPYTNDNRIMFEPEEDI